MRFPKGYMHSTRNFTHWIKKQNYNGLMTPLTKFRFRHVLLGFLLVSLLIFLFDSCFAPSSDLDALDVRFVKSGGSAEMDQKYAIDTPGCKIPELDPFDPSIRNFTKRAPPFHCPGEGGFGLTYLEDSVLKVNTDVLARFPIDQNDKDSMAQFHCCLWAMYRNEIEEQDDFLRFPSECVRFQDSIAVTTEYLKVECFLKDQRIYETFLVNLMEKPQVEERCKNAPKKCPNHDRMGVILLFLDSVSRVNFRRNLPDSRKVLVEELRAIELHGYNRVADNTFPNLVPLLTGMSEEEVRHACWKNDTDPFDECPFIWKDFATAGFRTAFIEDFPDIGAFHLEKGGFQRQPTDYYGHSFLKEAMKLMCQHRDCLNEMSETEVIIQWCHDYIRFFRNRKHFALFATSRFTHHENISHTGWVDPLLKHHLRAMKYDGLLENSFLFIISDHGTRYGPFRETVHGGREVNLPVFYVALPEAFERHFPEAVRNLRDNARKLTTPYDLYMTLKDIVNCNFSPSSWSSSTLSNTERQMTSLFQEIPDTRTCSEVGIPQGYCSCYVSETFLSHDLDIVQRAYQLLIDQLNNFTEPYRHLCALFVPDYILRAREIHFLNSENNLETFYEVVFGIEPGLGLFQGIVTHGFDGMSLVAQPEISRLDMYGRTSACVAYNSMLRKYCHCI